jgi:hypothetical protein
VVVEEQVENQVLITLAGLGLVQVAVVVALEQEAMPLKMPL